MSTSTAFRPPWRLVLLSLVIALLLSLLSFFFVHATSTKAASAGGPFIGRVFDFRGHHIMLVQNGVTPPTDAQCRAKLKVPCYSPQEIRRAYGVTPLIDAGYTGKGQTIIIIDSFGSPTIRHDLAVFDKAFDLPAPPSFRILAPLGTVPFNPNNSDQAGWAGETTLDVEWAHAIAPGANIVLLTSPVSETEGVQGMPQFLYLENYALEHHLGKIISQSWGATEETLFSAAGRRVVEQFNEFYKRADEDGFSIFASSGDSGVSNVNTNNQSYPFRTIIFPASSPYVTAVGGTSLYADTRGNYNYETVWNNTIGASGGGVSKLFKEPDYQREHLSSSQKAIVNNHRGMPDIAWNADPDTGVLIYFSFLGPKQAGFSLIGGTSAGSPQWSGMIADGNQLAGHSLGFLNPVLYRLGDSHEYHHTLHDITIGNNSFNGITGFDAVSGWDLTTGWGTPKADDLLHELAADTGN